MQILEDALDRTTLACSVCHRREGFVSATEAMLMGWRKAPPPGNELVCDRCMRLAPNRAVRRTMTQAEYSARKNARKAQKKARKKARAC